MVNIFIKFELLLLVLELKLRIRDGPVASPGFGARGHDTNRVIFTA